MGKRARNLDELKVYKEVFDLALVISKVAADFDGKYKYIYGNDLVAICWQALKKLIYANGAFDKAAAARMVYEVTEDLTVVEQGIRLASALGLISDRIRGNVDAQIVKARNEARGWREWFIKQSRGGSSAADNAAAGESQIIDN